MSATETVVFRAVLDAREFNTGVGAMRSEVEKAGSAVGKNASGLQTFQQRVEKAATATSGMASAFGGMGNKAGAAFGAVSNLASAFLVGGPLVAGVSAAAFALGRLGEKMGEATKKAAAFDAALRDGVLSRRQELTATLEEWTRRVEDFGKTSEEVSVARANASLAEASQSEKMGRMHLGQMIAEESRVGRREVAWWDTEGKIAKQAELNMLRERIARQKELNKSDEEAVRVIGETISKMEELRSKQGTTAKAGRGGGSRGGGRGLAGGESILVEGEDSAFTKQLQSDMDRQSDIVAFGLAEQQSEREMFDAWMSNSMKAQTDMVRANKDIEVRAFKAAEQEKLEAAKKAAEEYRAFAARTMDVTMQVFSVAVDVSRVLAEGMVTSQDHIADRMAEVALRGIGSILVAEGTRAIYTGGIRAIESYGLDLTSYALMGAGALAVGAGVGMGAVGTAIGAARQQSAGGFSSGSGSGGRLESRDRARRAGGGGEGDSQTVNINFNGGTQMGDPTERARTLARDARRVNREVYTPRRRR